MLLDVIEPQSLTAPANAETAPPKEALLPHRLAIALALLTGMEALAVLWILAPAGSLPGAGVFAVAGAAQFACAATLALSALIAPWLSLEAPSYRVALARAAFISIWQGVVVAFLLMVCARSVPLAPIGILNASAWLALCMFSFVMLNHLLPRASAGILFFWIVAIPVLCFIVAELILAGAGGRSWTQLPPEAQSAKSLIHWALALSPATGAAGALSSTLADGSAYEPLLPLIFLSLMNAALAGWRLKTDLPLRHKDTKVH